MTQKEETQRSHIVIKIMSETESNVLIIAGCIDKNTIFQDDSDPKNLSVKYGENRKIKSIATS